MCVSKRYQFRDSGTVQARLDALSEKRKRSTAEILKIAVDIGLATLESGRHIDAWRQITLLEITATLCDMIAKKLVPENAEEMPTIVLQNLAKFHGEV